MQKQFTKDHTAIVKGVAVLLLLSYHLFGNEFVNMNMEVNHAPLSRDAFLQLANFGQVCVAVFVFMTAFGISTGLFAQNDITAKDAYSQTTKRFFTLMLNYFLLYASVNLLWWYKFDYTSVYGIGKQGLLNVFFDATGLFNFFDAPTLNTTWWYMGLAYPIIFLVPFLAISTKKVGYPIIIISFMAILFVEMDYGIERYLLCMVFGVCAAYGKWLDRLLNIRCPRLLQWLIGLVGFAACILVRQNKEVQNNYLYIVDAAIAFFLVCFAGILLSQVPVLKQILRFIGKHSMNIYLVHTFFYLLLWQKYIYAFRYAWLILPVLLGVCLLYSIVLEIVKKLLNRAFQFFMNHICKN